MATTLKTSSTTSSEGLRRFGVRCAAFFAPLAVGLVLTLKMLYRVGELHTPDSAVELQQQAQVVYLPEFHKWPLFFPRYHLRGAIERNPQVLVLGSSRVKTIRSVFFRDPARQFNAGIPATESMGAWRRFLEAIPEERQPRTVLLGIDPWWFRAAAEVQPDPEFLRPYSTMEIVDFAWRRGFWWSLKQLREHSATAADEIGVQARREKSGLRPDGSLYTAKNDPDKAAEKFEEHLKSLREGGQPFVHDLPTLSVAALDELHAFLAYCQAHHIHVVAFIPSVSPTYFAAMKTTRQIDYVWNLSPTLAPIFQQAGAEYHDFFDPASTGCRDQEYFDPLHEAEPCTLRLLTAMASKSAAVGSLVDPARLQELLAHRRSDWQLER